MSGAIFTVARPVLAATSGMIVMLVVVAVCGYPLAAVARGFATATFGSPHAMASVALVAVPLMLTGLAVCVAFRCGVLNIGAEGQYLMGALAATWVGLNMHDWPRAGAVVTPIVAGILAGAAWAAIPAWLRLRRGVQEVLSTILLNFIAIQIIQVLTHGPLADPAAAAGDSTAAIATNASLPMVDSRHGLHAGILAGPLVAIGAWFLLTRTVAGFRIRIVGANPVAARVAGLSVTQYALASFLLSGALAGLAGAIELTGNTQYLTAGYASGYGYTAIAIVMLARQSALAIVPAAAFFAILDVGIRGLQRVDVPGLEGFPTALTYLAQGVVVLFALLLMKDRRPHAE